VRDLALVSVTSIDRRSDREVPIGAERLVGLLLVPEERGKPTQDCLVCAIKWSE
jgi:hypothetical protein